ncbi:plasmid mobilization relaxosome protein MobC [Micromonospora maris]|uniref:plasmid mobilization relaxosome protein MobC n=1 Tax=Micromonospora maris TaxID=1003110 RepID=UPI0005BC37DB|nr:plasmid mobilization relaxosome protein MobC [Micromonospora maris]
MAEPAQVGVVRFGAQQRRRRRHNDADPRVHRVTVRLSTEELAAVTANAAAARMAVAAYLAEAGAAPLVPAANAPDGPGETSALLVELMGVHRQVRGAATNLNQAVARLHATGEPAGDLAASAAYVARIAARVDELVTAIAAAQTGRR